MKKKFLSFLFIEMNENIKQQKDNSKEKSQTNLIKSNLKSLLDDKIPVKEESKSKENINIPKIFNSESPILKIAKKQKSKQIAEMIGEIQSGEIKIGTNLSINSLENEFLSPDISPAKKTIQTPQPNKSCHKVSKSTFLQHKYLENLVAKPVDRSGLDPFDNKKPFSINLNTVPNNIINEVEAQKEETPNNVTLKFNSTKFDFGKDRTTSKKATNIKDSSDLKHHPFRHLIFSPKITENLFKKHLLITYKGIIYSQKLQNPSENFLKSRAITLSDSLLLQK